MIDVRNRSNHLFPPKLVSENAVDCHSSRCKEHRVRRREIITFAVQNNELGKRDQIYDSERSIASTVARTKQPKQAGEPERKRPRIHENNLLRNELHRVER